MKAGGLAAILGLAVALTGAASGQQVPHGWVLEEDATTGVNDIFLYWYDQQRDKVLVSINCQEGYGDVTFTAYMDRPEGAAPREVVLVDGDTRHGLEAISGEVGGRYSVGGITSFGPELRELLSGQFTVLVDGVEVGQYSTKGAREEFARIIGACPAGG
ncbi:MAG: hypothetical protein JWR51_2107 [Devosia sp.]|uniref:hypothetical protein n=1 Tax=Devosia sp. TaxID=1871048 RepID=UPI002619FEF7|nr:hypothetical protein [Devosia sp.]MDB5529004.1 hypothetical protein [Devosia sp.]